MNAFANPGVVSHVVNTKSGVNGSHGRTFDEQLLVPGFRILLGSTPGCVHGGQVVIVGSSDVILSA